MTHPSSSSAAAASPSSDGAAQRGSAGQRRAVIVGAGPNGLTAAAYLSRAGWDVDVYERQDFPGGAAASVKDSLAPGTVVDLGAAGHPLGIASPVFEDLNLEGHGLRWAHSRYPMAHPLPDGMDAALLRRDVSATADGLGVDSTTWKLVHRSVADNVDKNLKNIMGPLLRLPAHPMRLAQFGLFGSVPSTFFTRTAFREQPARALFIGSAAHANTPLGHPFTSAYGALFGALGMTRGWPVVVGGTGSLVDALVSVVTSHGGRIHTGVEVADLDSLGAADAHIVDLTPAQILTLKGSPIQRIPESVKVRFRRWRYGSGIFKVDFLLDGPVPWTDPRVGEATTVHVGGLAAEIRLAEAQVETGRMPDRPFVMVCQQQVADPSRVTGEAADKGQHVLWAYAHVPAGYQEPHEGFVRQKIIDQITRFAPDFPDRIVAAQDTGPDALHEWNPNIIGGDIAGGAMTRSQSVLRPGLTLEPYTLGDSGVYVCSASTPPGPGVHGMPGYWAAQAVLRDRGA